MLFSEIVPLHFWVEKKPKKKKNLEMLKQKDRCLLGSSFKQQCNPAKGHELPLAQIMLPGAFPMKCIRSRSCRDKARRVRGCTPGCPEDGQGAVDPTPPRQKWLLFAFCVFCRGLWTRTHPCVRSCVRATGPRGAAQ